ncbi:MAG: CaiB/BaiF CoA transferase family protein [Propylenella sp.]
MQRKTPPKELRELRESGGGKDKERRSAAPRAAKPAAKPLPLAGFRVLDVSQVMAGPFCCMLLGDMGADVIKVEPPGSGDQTRRSMEFRLKGEDSPGFLALNRNKRSIAIDLKSAAGRNVFYALARTADVVVENSRPGVAERLKIDYATLAKINPRLVYASISGFGQTGPWAERPGFDLIAQAMSGIMSATGHPGQEPVKSTIPVADLGAGMFAAYGILSALLGRERTGRGQYIDASLFEAALGLSVWETTEYWATGKPPGPIGTANRMSAPYQAGKASDGYFVFGAANQKLWRALCETVGRADLLADPRFAQNPNRVKNREALIAELSKDFQRKRVSEWVERLLAAGVPAAPIHDYAEALASDHVRARRMVMEVEHPTEGSYTSLGFPVKLSDTPQEVRLPPPLLDQHRDEILAEIGLSDQLAELEQEGAFGK